ncbi:MAG: hypothetical protein J6Q22_12125 [Prevotella sp.]|nr:hypothetical protein [Prevotella sp.]
MSIASVIPTNPWTLLTKENIAQCDQSFFDQYGNVAKYENMINSQFPKPKLDFSCLPDPFCGDPKCKVYCLNKNPGEPDKCFVGNASFEKATKENLNLKQTTCFWAENIKNSCGKVHDGVMWLTKRTNELEKILGRHPDIFFVEYFPYHSTYGFDFPCNLPSYTFTDALIKQAMEDRKMIIIMREKRKWLKRIPYLDSYSNLFCLKSAQGGYLTLKNIVKYSYGGAGRNININEIKQFF